MCNIRAQIREIGSPTLGRSHPHPHEYNLLTMKRMHCARTAQPEYLPYALHDIDNHVVGWWSKAMRVAAEAAAATNWRRSAACFASTPEQQEGHASEYAQPSCLRQWPGMAHQAWRTCACADVLPAFG